MLKVIAVLFVLGFCFAPIGLLFEDEPYLVTYRMGSLGAKSFHVTGEIAIPRRFQVSLFTGHQHALERIVAFDEVIETPDSSISTSDIFRIAKGKAEATEGRWVFHWTTLPGLGVFLLITCGLA